MNDGGEFRNVGTLPISAAAAYRRDGRMTSGLNGVKVWASGRNPLQITDYLLQGDISRSHSGCRIQSTELKFFKKSFLCTCIISASSFKNDLVWNKFNKQLLLQYFLQRTQGGTDFMTLQGNRTFYLFSPFHHALSVSLTYILLQPERWIQTPSLSTGVRCDWLQAVLTTSPTHPYPLLKTHTHTVLSTALCSVLPRLAPGGKQTGTRVRFS